MKHLSVQSMKIKISLRFDVKTLKDFIKMESRKYERFEWKMHRKLKREKHIRKTNQVIARCGIIR